MLARAMSSAVNASVTPESALVSLLPVLAALSGETSVDVRRFRISVDRLSKLMDADSARMAADELRALLDRYRKAYGLDGPWII